MKFNIMTFEEIFSKVKNPLLQDTLRKMHADAMAKFNNCPASGRHHHISHTGYYDHVREVCINIIRITESQQADYGCEMYELDEAIFLAYIHDIDKLNKYQTNTGSGDFPYKAKKGESCEATALVAVEVAKYGVLLTPPQLHALAFHHGGWSNLYKEQPYARMSPLATALHAADLLSANLQGQLVLPGWHREFTK